MPKYLGKKEYTECSGGRKICLSTYRVADNLEHLLGAYQGCDRALPPCKGLEITLGMVSSLIDKYSNMIICQIPKIDKIGPIIF